MQTVLTFPFEGPKQKVRWARYLVQLLKEDLDIYADQVTFTIGPDQYSAPHEKYDFYRLIAKPRMALSISMRTHDAVFQLRSALDILVCDVGRMQGKNRQFSFPFAEDSGEFDHLMRKHPGDDNMRRSEVRKLGPDVVEFIKAYKPFRKEGDPILRGMNDLCNHMKHRMVVPLIGAASLDQFSFGAPAMMVSLGGRASVYENRRFQVQKGLPFDTSFKSAKMLPPIFPSRLPFGGKPVVETLEVLTDYTDKMVDRFASAFGPDHLSWNPSNGC